MERCENEYSIALMCRVLEVSRSGYHAYRTRPSSHRDLENKEFVKLMVRAQKLTRQSYGSPRMKKELRDLGKKCGRNRVARLMRENGLGARRKMLMVIRERRNLDRVSGSGRKNRLPRSRIRDKRQVARG